MHRPGRRQFLRAGGAATLAGLSGCLMGGPPTGGDGSGGGWEETYGDDDYTTYFWGVTATSDGGFLAAGSEGSADQSQDALLVKVDADGDEEWTETYGEEGWQWFNKAVETDGGYLAGGASSGGGGDVALLVGVDDDGDEDWRETYEELAVTWTYDMATTPDGGVILAGRTNEGDYEVWEPWVLKADSDGDEDWRETYDADDLASAELNGVTATDGGFLLTGQAREEGSNTPVGYAVGIDEDGDEAWTETYDDGRFWWSTADGDRSVIAGGTDAFRDGEAWLLAVDSEGEEVWSETYDTDGPATLNDVVSLGDGGLLDGLLGGGDGGYLAVGSVLDDTGDNDRTGVVLRVDEDGELQDDAEWDDDGNSSITSVVEAGGTHVLGGYVDDDGSGSDGDRPQGRLVRDRF